MKIDIVDLNRFIQVNECPKVDNPVFFNSSRQPTASGVFSYELFGISGSYNRKTVFGYVDLKRNFLHPVVYKMLVSMDKKIANIVEGSRHFRLVHGELVEDQEGGETGLKFLYDNWDKMRIKSTDSSVRDDKLSVLASLDRSEIWVDKWLVFPPYYRDVNFAKIATGKISVDPINNMYSTLIRMCDSLGSEGEFDFIGTVTENKIQLILVDVYSELSGALAKKTGYTKQALLGKAVDYATRSVNRMVNTQAPLIEKMTLFWHGHFVVSKNPAACLKDFLKLLIQMKTLSQ